MTYTIRPARKEDIDQICKLCIKSADIYLDLKVLSKGQFSTFFNATITRQRMFKELNLDDTSCSVAVDSNNKIIGFCKGSAISASNKNLVEKQFKIKLKDSHKVFHFQSIYIDPDNKQKGIGNALMKEEAGKALARGFNLGFTTVLSGNTSPVFFKKLGATHLGNFIQNPFTNEISNDNKPPSNQFLSQEAYGFKSLESILKYKHFPPKNNKAGLKKHE